MLHELRAIKPIAFIPVLPTFLTFSLYPWLHLIHEITCPSCSYPPLIPCITHLLPIFPHVWGPIILPKSRGSPKHCKISNQWCAFKGDTRWQFDDEEADLWGFLGFCLYENVSYGYGFVMRRLIMLHAEKTREILVSCHSTQCTMMMIETRMKIEGILTLTISVWMRM